MTDAEKLAKEAQATADAKAATEKAAAELAAVGKPPPATGLDSLNREQLKELYKKSPDLFKDIVEPKVDPPPEVKKDPPPNESAAPTFGDKEVVIPKDVPVNSEYLAARLANWKELGFSHAQVQGQIDFEVKQFRAQQQAAPKPTAKEIDAANIKVLEKEFGTDFKVNMEIARQAAVQFADAEMLEKLKTSDPALIRHFLKLGKLNANDGTPNRGSSRNGNETEDAEGAQKDHLKRRYNNPTSQTMFRDNQ